MQNDTRTQSRPVTGPIQYSDNEKAEMLLLTDTLDILKPEEASDATDHRRVSINLYTARQCIHIIYSQSGAN